MTAEQITTIVVNVLTSGSVITCVWLLARGLKREIASLNRTIETQNKTLEVMEKRVSETEKVGAIYKNLIEELPDHIDKYRKLITTTKDTIIAELERAIQHKDEKLKKSKELDLRKLELQEQMLADFPKLRQELLETTQALQQRLEAVNFFKPVTIETRFLSTSWNDLITLPVKPIFLYEDSVNDESETDDNEDSTEGNPS